MTGERNGQKNYQKEKRLQKKCRDIAFSPNLEVLDMAESFALSTGTHNFNHLFYGEGHGTRQ